MRTSILLLAVAIMATGGCTGESGSDTAAVTDAVPPPGASVRFATWNVSLYSNESGGVIAQLEAGDESLRQRAAVIQHLRPDVLLLNEFDFDSAGRALTLFQRNYLEVGQFDQAPLRYDYHYLAPVNTGEPSGLDLDGNGAVAGGGDAWGYGRHPGQYGMVVLSRYPIDITAVRTFRRLLWSRLPEANRPLNPDGSTFHSEAIWRQLRLSSKSHWDVPVRTPLGTIHVLASHPTPPVFDGPENLNGLRNLDEIRLWQHYLGNENADWLCDDSGRCGGLAADAPFVLMGDQNSDPHDGDSLSEGIEAILNHPRVNASQVPQSEGGAAQASRYGLPRAGDTRSHTGDFGPRTGTLRLDYVLPSRDLAITSSGVFWPLSPPQHVTWTSASDHHLVWVDVTLPQ
jgi:endonuclease/exonuclease/phosphatase family metal-dependent hydrolase